jgi:hypothetical protein
MAVLGSTVDPRLGAVSPAAIQALSQAGAATGQMYQNLGGSIAGVIQDFKSKKDDSSLQQAYLDSLQIDDDGNQKVDRKAFLQKAKDNKVSSKLANAYLKNELEISSMQNQMDIQNKMANLEGRRVDIAEDQQKLAGEAFTFEKEFKTADQRLRVSQWASDNLVEMQKLNAMREANTITQKQYDKDYKLAKKKYRSELRKLDQSEDLTRAQVRALKAETVLKQKEADLTQAEIDSYEDGEGLIGNEVALTNGVSQLLGIDSAAFQALDVNARKSLIDERLAQVRLGGGNLEDPNLEPLKKLSDLYLNQGFLRMSPEEFSAYQQQQNQLKQQEAASVSPPNRLQTSFGGQYGGMFGG